MFLQIGISATDVGPHIQNLSYLGMNSEGSYDRTTEMYFYLELLYVFVIALVFL